MPRVAPTARAALAPIALGLARARAAPVRWSLPALGVALAAGLLGVATGGGVVAGEQAARDAVRDLSPAARTIRLTWAAGLPEGTDARGRRLLRRLTPAAQTRSVLLLPTAVSPARDGATSQPAQLAAIAPLSRWVRLRSGRLPRSCTPVRCEVLAAGGGSAPPVAVRNGTRLVTVGRAVLTSAGPLGFTPASGAAAAGAPRRPLLLAADPAAVDALTGFAAVFRTHGWSAPLSTGGRASWDLPALQARWRAVRAEVTSTADGFALDAPEQALQTARQRAHDARRRTVLVGAGAAALLAAFVVLAAAALRRDLDGERDRLTRRGARRGQLVLLSLTEAAVPATTGLLAGAVVAAAVTLARAHAAGLPAGATLVHAFGGGALAGAAGTWVAAVALLALAARGWGGTAARGFDVAAAGAVAVVAVLLAGGDTARPGTLVPALLPPLVCLAAGLVIARGSVWALRGLEAAGRRGPLPLRLAGLGLARAPAGPALTVAVVAVACGLSCFAWGYRATLHRGDRDQAAYAVPLDVTVRATPGTAGPLAAAPAARWRALAGGGAVLAVQRASASVPRGAGAVELPVLGVPSAGLAAIHGWRDADASSPRNALARRLRLPGAGATHGLRVAAGERLAVTLAAAGDAVDVTALLGGADGSVVPVALGPAGPAARQAVVRLPAGAAGRRLLGLEISRRAGVAATGGHQQAENDAAPTVPGGTLTVRGLRVGANPVPIGRWRGHGPLAAPAPAPAGGVRAAYRFDRAGRALLAVPQPGDDRMLPVVTDRATAASAGPRGILPVTVLGERLRARVVGTVARFPTIDANADGVVVADRAALAAVLDARSPGSAQPGELWIGVRGGTPERRLLAALRAPPLSGLEAVSRRAAEHRLRADPLARELVRTLATAALAALALAALGVLVAVALALRDDAAELLDLEALGVPPRLLRADVRVRAAVLASGGLISGLALAGVLTALVVDAVQATAAGTLPVPPLVAVLPAGAWAASAAAFAALVAGGTALLTWRALGGSSPRRGGGVAA